MIEHIKNYDEYVMLDIFSNILEACNLFVILKTKKSSPF